MSKENNHHFKYPVLAVSVLLIIAGFFSYSNLKTNLFPDITFPKIKVIADAGQLPVDKMMTTITVPLENYLKRTEGIDHIRSTTARGSCEISVFLKWNTDVDKAKQQIDALVNEVKNNLPSQTNINVQKMNPSILPVMGYSLEGNRSDVELRTIARSQIKPWLASAPGVSDVAIIGGKTKEYQIVVYPDKLSALGISLKAIQDAVLQANILKSNGYINDHHRLYLTLTDNAVNNIDELKNLVLLNNSQRRIKLNDVASIELHEAKEYVKINANGKDVPLIAIFKQPDANLIDVNNGIEQRVNELKNILPKDLHLIPYYKQADFVNDTIKSIRDVLLIGLLLSILIVIVFLKSGSTSIVVLITIPVTLCLTVIILYVIGYTFNIMTLGAIAAAVGLMIDDAVIIVEQIHRGHEENPEKPMSAVIGESIQFLFPAMISSSLCTIVIFVPFILMTGIAGAYFKVLALTMIITLTSSFFVTWLILPMLFLVIPITKKEKAVYLSKRKWVTYLTDRPLISLLFVSGCIFVMIIIPSHLQSGFLPEMDEGSIVFDFNSPAGTSIEETDFMLQKADSILMKQPEVEKFSRRLGTQMGFFITEPNRGDYLIQLKKKRSKSTDEVIDEIRKQVESSVPQLKIDFGQIIMDMLGDLMSSVQPIEIKIFGDKQTEIEKLSKQVASELENINGVADVFDGIVIAGPEVKIQPNVSKLLQYGLTASDFQFQLQTQIEGTVITTIPEKDQQVDVRLIYPEAQRTSIHSMQNSSILLADGKIKPISTVADIQIEKGVAEINRENQKMAGIITARLNNRDLGSTLKDIQQTLKRKINLPPGYTIEYGGSYAQQQNAFKELLRILFASVLSVFIVMLFLFRRIKISLIIICLAILGVAGCLLALMITGTALNVGSYTGIIMVVGIIAENAIFTYWQYLQSLKSMSKEESLIFSMATRLRPKLMTASGAIIALMPLALGIGTGAQLHQPLAIAVIGGLIIALPLLLVVFPTTIKYLEKN